MRAVLGLSGGVDSSVAAQLLTRDGYEVLGVYLKSCRNRDDSAAARAAAEAAGIDFRIANMSDALEKNVVTPFIQSYLHGRTPNPCVFCNPTVKFPTLFRIADEWGAELVATGHYARIVFCPSLGKKMIAAANCGNDQSYMLCRLTSDMVQRLAFPLAEAADKREVRQFAADHHVATHDKPDSMEICFIPDNDRIGFLEREAGDAAIDALRGDFVDAEGNVLGRHEGIHRYTVGQRRGLAMAFGERAYVVGIDGATKHVILGDNSAVMRKVVRIEDCVWHHLPEAPFAARVRVRHSRGFTDGVVTPEDGGRTAEITFESGVRAPAPGQSAVCYADVDGVENVLLGGGFIADSQA